MESEIALPSSGSVWTGPREEPRRYRVDLDGSATVDIGGGGEGLVYQAHCIVAGEERIVALKMHTGLPFDDFELFRERAGALSEIDHPNVMHLIDVFVGTALIDHADPPDDAFNVMYTVAEWIPGLSLPAALEATSPASGLRWVAQIARAASYLHGFRSTEAPAGVVHRDIKPSNVRITPDERAVLIDFGIARPHQEGDHTEGAGTYLWRAPEVIGGPGDPGPASDAWGVGALAYWVLLAEPPRLEGAAAAREILVPAAHGAGIADSKGLGRQIGALLETHPQRRPGDLSRWADEMELRAAGKHPHRPARLAAIAAAVLVLAGVLTGVTHSLGVTPAPSPSQSKRVANEAVAHLTTDARLGTLLSLASYRRAPTGAARSALIKATEQPLAATLQDGSPVTSIAYSGNGSRLVTGDSAGNVLLWNTAARKPIDHLRTGGQVTSVAISPNGRLIAAGDVEGVVDLWGTGLRSPLRSSLRVGAKVTSVVFSPNGTLLAFGTVDNSKIAGAGNGKVFLWNPSTSQEEFQPVPYGSSATSVAFDPTGAPPSATFAQTGSSLVAFGAEDGAIGCWYVDTGVAKGRVDRLTRPDETAVSSITFSPDGQTLAANYAKGQVGLWKMADTNNSQVPVVFPVGDNATDASFNPNGNILAVAYANGYVRLWDTTNPSEKPEVIAVGSAVTSVAFSPDGEELATGEESGTATLWAPAQSVVTLTPLGTALIDSVAFSSVGNVLAAANYSGDVTLWDAVSRSELSQFSGEADQIPSVALDRDGQLVATGDFDGNVEVWDTLSSRKKWVRDIHSEIFSVAFSPNQKLLATGIRRNKTVLWNSRTGARLGILDQPDGRSVRSVAFSPNGTILATADDGGEVTLWRVSDHRLIRRLLVDSNHESVRSVAFSPNGAILAAGDNDGDTTLWDPSTGARIDRFSDHSQVVSLVFSSDGKSLVTGDANGSVVTWNIATGTATSLPIAEHSQQVYSLALNSDGSILSAASDNTSVTILPSIVAVDSSQELAAILCQRISGNLTPSQWTRYVKASPYQKVCPAS
jgi:WD40 repeat protein